MEIVPISRFRERLSCTEIEVLCRAHALSLCSPRAPVSLTPRAQTWDFGWQASPALWTRVACHARLDTSDARASSSQHWLGWSGDLVMDALALILPIWRPASSAKALVDDILLLSPSISRYCYLWFGQPQLLSNATSGYGFHATASRLSQLVPSRSLSSSRTSCGTKKYLSIFFFFHALRRHAFRRHALRRHAFRRQSRLASPPKVWLMDISILFPTNI